MISGASTAARIKRSLEPGTSILIGTVDPQGFPACCRGIAVTSTDDLKTARVYVPIATSHETIANIATTGRITIVACHPVEHETVQIKGIVTGTQLANESEAVLVRDRLAQFGSALNRIGIPPRVTRTIGCWPAFAIDVRVDDIFEQTPGPNAGVRLPRDLQAARPS
jgi:hypothetical protein